MHALGILISDWLKRLQDTETPYPGVVAYHFGLLDGEDNFYLFLIGSKEYDEDDNDWVFVIDYEPEEKYLAIPPALTKGLILEEMMDQVAAHLEKILSLPEWADLFINKADHITVGFDKTDLIKIK
ncbi:MAG: hypothetical protein GC171_15680 [Terrimonas sp.]|nr:hypothetical protein [Terrimonas sp.]